MIHKSHSRESDGACVYSMHHDFLVDMCLRRAADRCDHDFSLEKLRTCSDAWSSCLQHFSLNYPPQSASPVKLKRLHFVRKAVRTPDTKVCKRCGLQLPAAKQYPQVSQAVVRNATISAIVSVTSCSQTTQCFMSLRTLMRDDVAW